MLTIGETWCEYATNPLGVDAAAPRFSWILEASERGAMQSGYQILVASTVELLEAGQGDKWDSNKVVADRSVNVAYAGSALGSGERCFWAVRVWDAAGHASVYSAPAHFEMGLLDAADWSGGWIGSHQKSAAALLRKELSLDKPVAEARLYLSGLGLYELYLNGQRVGDHVLDPVLTDYRKRVAYVPYDVTEQLQRGINTLAVVLGNGWYRGERWGFDESLALLLQLNIAHPDGTTTTLSSDASWKLSSGPIIANSLQNGEVYDARLEQPGWQLAGFDDSGWSNAQSVDAPAGALFSQQMPAMQVIETREPESLSVPRPGIAVYDFGQLFGGWVRIRLQGATGTEVTIKHSSRILPDGTIDDAAGPPGGRHLYSPRRPRR
jgi:alpha-L-rhamnosidase